METACQRIVLSVPTRVLRHNGANNTDLNKLPYGVSYAVGTAPNAPDAWCIVITLDQDAMYVDEGTMAQLAFAVSGKAYWRIRNGSQWLSWHQM